MIDILILAARGAELNAALARNPDRDVVLLDEGIELPDGAIDRLAACARREPLVATVTPFSNDAAFCSYRADMPAAELDRLFARENAGMSVDVPSAIPGCVFIAREAIRAVGGFDERFGGADAVVDFCLRASRAGYRHLLCADVYVSRATPAAPNSAEIHERHPAFAQALALFLGREPTRPFRRRVDLARLAASPRPRVLMVTHNWEGGVDRHVRDLARLMADECEVVRMRPAAPNAIEIAWLREGEELAAWIDAAEWPTVVDMLASIGIDRVHFHHVHDLPRDALALPAALAAPYDVTLHDYFPFCPRYHPPIGTSAACTIDQPQGCERCLERGPDPWGLGLAGWRELFHRFLRGAERVIAPSHDLAARMRRHFADVAFLEWPHPEMPRAMSAVTKVALLGSLSAQKGARLLEACVADAMARALPLHFVVLGHVDRPMPTWPDAPLTIAGSYSEDRLAELIAIERPDAFLFLSQVPETYSYTLTWAMRSALPIVATRVGAFPERLRGYRAHALVAADASPAAINEAVLARVRRGAATETEATPAE